LASGRADSILPAAPSCRIAELPVGDAMESLFSDAWYRVADLKPRLRSHARIRRHRYRGEIWYVLQDLASGRVHRFSPASYFVIDLMDGRRSVQEIWDTALAHLGDDAPTQDETIQLLGQLHSADILQCDVPPDAAELLQRHERQQRSKVLGQVMNPLWWRFPLLDPERFLGWLLPVVRPLVGPVGACLWALVVGAGVVLAAVHWSDLSSNFLDRVFTAKSLVVLWLLFPLLKAVHEVGHGLATKAFGGEVHDMGVMLLVFSPLPYVDASSASAFPSKWQRVVVGAAGMMVELVLASCAMFVWLAAEAGIVRTLAYNTILVAGFSTVVFNANPLLRYDGYYILTDLLEIPNLYTRSRTYLGYLCQRYLFGQREADPPQATPGERVWFVIYAVSAFAYRLLVIAGIAFFLLKSFFYLGLLAVALLMGGWLLIPLWKTLAFLFTSPSLRRVRVRAIGVTLLLLGAVVGVVGFLPVPSRTETEGVVWVPEEAIVRAGADGFVVRVLVRPGARVRPGTTLIECQDSELQSRIRVLSARLRELRARYDEQRPTDRVKAGLVQEEVRFVEEDLAQARERVAGLVIRSQTEGTFVLPTAEDLPGRFVRRGELLGYTVNLDKITVRAVVSQAHIDMVRHRTRGVEVRLLERIDDTLPAAVRREVPGASERLPSPALGQGGGGRVAVDPRDSQGLTAMERIFQVDLELPSQLGLLNVGGRARVQFEHDWEPLATQWARQIRQLFLARLNA
jgi:putative peptide zinc metalloprotease protein